MLQVSHVAESRDCFKETIIAVRCGRKRVAAFNGVAGLNSRGIYARLPREARHISEAWFRRPEYRCGFAPDCMADKAVRELPLVPERITAHNFSRPIFCPR